MKILDPHIDIACIYDEYNLPIEDFFSDRTDIPVTLKMLRDSNIKIVGTTLFRDPHLCKIPMYDGVMEYYSFYQKLFGMSDNFVQISKNDDLNAIPERKIGYFYSIEGLECIRNIGDFEKFHELGVNIFGLTWEDANAYASGNGEAMDNGITAKGRELLKLMEQREVVVDTAHLGQKSFKDLERAFNGVIINTHSNCRAICEGRHNLSDDQIQMIVDRKGIVCLLPTVGETGGEGTFEDLYRHLDYIASRWGIEYVGLCSDIFPSEEQFIGNATTVRVIKDFQEYLLTRMSEAEVEKVAFGNFGRVLVGN